MAAGKLYLSARRRKRTTRAKPVVLKVARPRRSLGGTKIKNFPQRTTQKLMYYSGNIGTTTTVSLGQHLFDITNCFDFDSTGGGHQPRGFDQWANFYNRYRVIDIKVTVHYQSTATSVVGLVFTPSTQTSLTDLTDAMEEQRSKSKVATLNGNATTIMSRIKPWTAESIKKSQYMDDSLYAATVTAEPATLPHLIVFWQNADETTSTGHTVNVLAELTVVFDVPKNITGS